MITLKSIIDSLSGFSIIESSIQNKAVYIYQVNFLQDSCHHLTPDTIYISKLSAFQKLSNFKSSSIFFLIKDDIEIGDPLYPDNYVLFENITNSKKLFQHIQSKLAVSRRITEANIIISQALYNDADITTLLEITADLLGNPVIVQDSSTKLLAHSNIEYTDICGDEVLSSLFKERFVTSDLFEKYDYTNVLDAIENRYQAFILESDQKKSRIIARLEVNQCYFGWVLTACVRKPFQDGDREIVDVLSNALTIILEKNSMISATNSCENLLLELLSTHTYTEDQFKARAEGFGWSLADSYYIFVITDRQETHTSNEEFTRTMMAHKNHLSLLFPTIKTLFYDEKLILFIDSSRFSMIEGPLINYLQNFNLVGALSNKFTNILEFKENYLYTLNILTIGLKLKRKNTVFYHEDMYIYHGISVLEKTDNLERYCLPQLLKVIEYDKLYNTEFAISIREYLKSRNVATTAEQLHIHRNTMLYRMDKFSEISNLDLRDGDTIYKLWLSFLVLDLFPELL